MRAELMERPQHVLVLSAKEESSLYDLAAKYVQFLRENPDSRLEDICFTAAVGRTHFEWRLAVTASSITELAIRLDSFLAGDDQAVGVVSGKQDPRAKSGKMAFLFAGQGAQYAGMARHLFNTEPTFRKTFLQCEEILAQFLEKKITKVLFEPSEEDTLLKQVRYTQSILCSLQYSCFRLWTNWGLKPDALMGHSMGEYVAAAAAGIMSLEDALRLVAKRIELVDTLTVPGEMGAVNADEKTVREYLQGSEDKVSIAALNGPQNTVVSGERNAVIAFLDKVKAKNVKVKLLAIGWPSHSPLLEEILGRFGETAGKAVYSEPKIPVISNLTGKVLEPGDMSGDYWRRHLRSTVKFAQGMNYLLQNDFRNFVEMGPGTTLLGMGQLSLDSKTTGVSWRASLTKERSDWDQLLETFSKLHVDGHQLNWKNFEMGYPQRHRVELPTYAFNRKPYWPEGQLFGAVSAAADETQAKSSRPQKVDMAEKLRNASEGERKELISNYLSAQVRKILHYAPDYEIDPNTELSKIGTDSLGMMELRNSIERDFMGLLTNLPRSLVFNYPTVNRLGDHLLELAFSNGGMATASATVKTANWVRNVRPVNDAQARLLCFHYAGGAAQTFDEIAQAAPPWLEVVGVQLPGRWERMGEEPAIDWNKLSPELIEALTPWTERPYAVLGYSMGAILSFDWMQKFGSKPGPLCFFPTSCGSPQHMVGKAKFPVDEDNILLLENFQKIIGPMPKQLVETAAIRDTFVPLLRADLKLLNSYSKVGKEIFDFPIHVLASKQDQSISEKSLEGWAGFSTSESSTEFFEGGHFLLAGPDRAKAFETVFNTVERLTKLIPIASKIKSNTTGSVDNSESWAAKRRA